MPKKPTPPKKPLTLLQKLQQAMDTRKIPTYTQQSYNWLIKEGQKLAGNSLVTRIMREERKRSLRANPRPINVGNLVLYNYDPKWKKKLPWWDSFPVGFIVSVEKDRFHLINLHYLNPRLRSILFDRLLSIANNPRADETTKLRLSYQVIKNVAKFKPLKVCYKEYLFSHMKSKMIKIHPRDWEKIMFLPLQKFNKRSSSVVWNDSSQKIKKP